ncbi:MFS transporter [Rhodoferax sp. GW822-FHT02A01]|uniref:MFS transporter n=1 Tax=Rhodoferax sp. GW822-FHT02A01 TaxID=3141537 RepID=UPI00315CC978
MSDLIYVLLPIWQSQFALSYAAAGLMRAMYSGVMATFQMLASRIAARIGRKGLLVAGMAMSGLAYLIAGQAGTLAALLLALMLGGLGASTQHPLASSLVAQAHEDDKDASRMALATYNFAGDIGKMLVPAAVGLALGWFSWQHCASATGLLGLGMAGLLAWLIPTLTTTTAQRPGTAGVAATPSVAAPAQSYSVGFKALLCTAVIDSATRMGFLTFLPFVLQTKGANTATTGIALTLLFVGGAVGKLVCGYLGRRLGMVKTVWLTEAATAVIILAVLVLPLQLALATLPLLGVALNGTSSVLYGSVPELVPASVRERAFALFYTGTIGAGSIAPVAFGWLGDQITIPHAMQCVAAFVCLTLPLVWIANKSPTH